MTSCRWLAWVATKCRAYSEAAHKAARHEKHAQNKHEEFGEQSTMYYSVWTLPEKKIRLHFSLLISTEIDNQAAARSSSAFAATFQGRSLSILLS